MAPVIVLEFLDLIQDMGGAHYYAMLGLWRQRKEMEARVAANPEIEGQATWVMAGPPDEKPPRQYLSWPTRQLIDEKLGRDGAFATQLSNGWVTGLFAAWEGRFRGELSRLMQLPEGEDLICDEMGDLRLMRNDILHNHAIASKEWTRRCRSLRWFEVGERIRVDTPHVYEFHQKVGPQIAEWVRRAAELEWEAIGEVPPWKVQ